MNISIVRICLLLGLAWMGWMVVAVSADPNLAEQQAVAQKLMKEGNFKDAYEAFRKLALDPGHDQYVAAQALTDAVQCLQRLGRTDEADAFREAVVEKHAQHWFTLQGVADSYLSAESYGRIVAGTFYRGQRRGDGQWAYSAERDRVRALQLYQQAMPLVAQDLQASGAGEFFQKLARALLTHRQGGEAWRLQALTDIGVLPDFEQGYYGGSGTRGAPVDDAGAPILHAVPDSWEKAANDGERWRWALAEAARVKPALLNETRLAQADFWESQFGVQTMAQYGGFFQRTEENDGDSGPWAVDTLAEDETIARLAAGVKRFKLPEEFNPIRIWQQIVAQPQTGQADQAYDRLASVFENRRQFPRAAEYWREAIQKHGPGSGNYRQERLNQIVKNWGRFETAAMQPAGTGATVDFRYRNGQKVHFIAHEIKIEKLLDDIKAHLKGRPAQPDWQRINIGNLGYLLVEQNRQEYQGAKVAEWDLELQPREKHLDRLITVNTPLQKAGAYLLSSQMADGNQTFIVLWVADTAIMKRPLNNKTWLMTADAVSGAPIGNMNVEFFGWRQVQEGNTNKFHVETSNYADKTDEQGQAILTPKEHDRHSQWLIMARGENNRLAFLGFTNVWSAEYQDRQQEQNRVFAITDRPVYRPKQLVKFKLWARQSRYDKDELPEFANREYTVEIRNPKNEKVLEKSFTSDAYGGIEGEYELPSDAPLGVYQLFIHNLGGGSFRVEEYKKPEFEVKVEAPTDPVQLGEKFTAKITAKYYFGSPVAKGTVKYKVLRSGVDERWYPPRPWDWLYGRGYGWLAYDYTWLNGWSEWGCKRPAPWWWGNWGRQQPEVVLDAEAPLGPDGVLSVEVDTSLAKVLHPDEDHRYQITAEVVDDSRRVIVGTGSVAVARKPFQVSVWVDHGYAKAGDKIRAYFHAHTMNQRPVEAKGEAELLRISYDDERQPRETSVRKWPIKTGEDGAGQLDLQASQAGQYRIAVRLKDKAGHEIEAGYVLTVTGPNFDGKDFRFDALELLPDKPEYAPGDKLKLMINTDRLGATVLLFTRPLNGVYLPPKLLSLDGKSTIETLDVQKSDMPNFFVEAVTIFDGKMHVQSISVPVPPEKRILNVAVSPDSATYQPGAPAKVRLQLTDIEGRPFVGSTVLSVYDKSVEYISGGSNIPEIREFFWKWKRNHYPNTETNLGRVQSLIVKQNTPAMGTIGVFGGLLDEASRGNNRQVERESGKAELRKAGAAPTAAAKRAMDGLGMDKDRDALADGREQQQAAQPGEPAAPLVQPTVRQKFADTAFWAGSVTTDQEGKADVEFPMPENLTTWKMRAWGMGTGTQVGQGESEAVTRKNVIVRLQAPRFFTERDEVVLSANVHSYLAEAKTCQVTLELEGDLLRALSPVQQQVELAPGGEARVDWRVSVTGEGQATVRMAARTDVESDAMQMSFPVFVHGMLKTESWSGAIRMDQNSGKVVFRVPADRRINESRLEVRYSPSLAAAMVDALPYLAEYPYGCTEQTLNRFLPTVITQRILQQMGLDLAAIRDKRTNLNAQEIGEAADRARGWKRFDRNPVFDVAELQQMTKDGVRALTEMQLGDGGWGWFSGYGELSTPHTTAYVVHGLQIANKNDVALVPQVLERGVAWLKNYQADQIQRIKNADGMKQPWKSHADNLDAFVYMVLVDAGEKNDEMRDFLYRDRVQLSVYAKAMFGLALHAQGEQEKLTMILRNIEQFVQQDDENQTAWLQLPNDNYWWYWYGSEVEANAYYLKLLARVAPQGETAPRLVKYLLNNRKHATYWNSTRDTSLAIEALAEYLQASGETRPDITVEVWLDGAKKKEVRITAAELFTFDNQFVLFGDAVETGEHTLELRKTGKTPLYFNAYLTTFTTEEHISKAGLEIKVDRKYYRLEKVAATTKVAGSRGQALDQRVEKYKRVELPNLAEVKSGDLIEVELEIDSKNDYEYLIFEDIKGAGFEPVDLRSGYNGNSLGAYVEFRDRHVAFFARALARGKHSVAYRLRAEIPGKFSALPTKAYAMYAPELRANSNEIKLKITD